MVINIGFRLSALQQANRAQRRILRWAMSVSLGANDKDDVANAGARYEQANGTQWLIFCDDSFRLIDIARLGTLCAGLPNVSETWADGKTREEIQQAAIDYVQDNIVWPVTIPEETSDPAAYVLAQQTNVPTWVRATQQIPDGLTPVQSETP